MTCPLCGQRKGRRECPALGQTICAICCGTKRLVEIRCPETCPHLTSSRQHPAAVVKRQQERDVALILPTISHLTERQYQLFFLFHSIVARHKPEGFGRLIDEDVAQAAAAVAATLETAARGVVYEHTPDSVPAQKLTRELTSTLTELRSSGTKIYDGEAAIALRAIEKGAREIRKAPENSGDDPYLVLMSRLIQTQQRQPEDAPEASSSLIRP